MGNKNPNINKIELKVLEIQEFPSNEPNQQVLVELNKGEQVGSVLNADEQPVPIFQGDMTYQRPGKKKKRSIDIVEAMFDSDNGETSEPGSIVLKIELIGDNTFVEPLVTTIPTDKTSVPSHCVKVQGSSATEITITFLEPAPGEYVAYPALYFQTSDGVIDPGFAVGRKPD